MHSGYSVEKKYGSEKILLLRGKRDVAKRRQSLYLELLSISAVSMCVPVQVRVLGFPVPRYLVPRC